MTSKERMFLESKAWALEKLSLDKAYFERLAGMHAPKILWIGSIDSLVPFREVINANPGDILVYRNMGVQVRTDDISMMATVQHAVEVSRVENIVICGYSHCSAIEHVVTGKDDDPPHVKAWLEELHELYENHMHEFKNLDANQRAKHLSELNIRAQISKLSQLDIIQKAWETGERPTLLGWYFDLQTGGLKEIFSMEAKHKLKQVASVA